MADTPKEPAILAQTLTGQAALLPRWAPGYWQSKNRYQSQQELLEIANTFRRENIPLDGVVQGWQYWPDGQNRVNVRTGKRHRGGQTLQAAAVLDEIPLFARAGTILPLSDGICHAEERRGIAALVNVYCGSDGAFTFYNDAGDI